VRSQDGPTSPRANDRSAAFYNFAGEPEHALKLLDDAAELDPFLHVWCIEERVAVLYNLERFREAIEAALRANLSNPPITLVPRGCACGTR
jgi:adenylate cyclase